MFVKSDMFGWFSGTKDIFNPVHEAGVVVNGSGLRLLNHELIPTHAVALPWELQGAPGDGGRPGPAPAGRACSPPYWVSIFLPNAPTHIPLPLPSLYLPLVPPLTVIHFILLHIGYFRQYLNNFVAVLLFLPLVTKFLTKKKSISCKHTNKPLTKL